MYRNDTIKFLNSLQRFGWQLGLEKITRILSEMGDPQLKFKSIHIAGTNGKGSTAAMLESIYRCAGYKTGLYTSPHLLQVNERIQINRIPISVEYLSFYVQRLKDQIVSSRGTYFEALTAIAFQYFADVGVELAVIEVGLGGRFDATNVIHPLLSIITDIDFDHIEHLGETKVKIAQEKAGVIKSGSPCISGSDDDEVNAVFRNISKERNADFFELGHISSFHHVRLNDAFSEFDLVCQNRRYPNLKVGLTGRYQCKNASLAVAATEILQAGLPVKEVDIYNGLRDVRWRGRLEKLQDSPKIVIDVAHNPAAVSAVIYSVGEIYEYDRMIVLIGLLADKDYATIARLITARADYVFVVTPKSERALPARQLGTEFGRYTTSFEVCKNRQTGFRRAVKHLQENDLLCVIGSHYVVGEFVKFYEQADLLKNLHKKT
jgi:dihydrofolate synthase/folylpolyglutamate synthase